MKLLSSWINITDGLRPFRLRLYSADELLVRCSKKRGRNCATQVCSSTLCELDMPDVQRADQTGSLARVNRGVKDTLGFKLPGRNRLTAFRV
jgi:hypothetical protein